MEKKKKSRSYRNTGITGVQWGWRRERSRVRGYAWTLRSPSMICILYWNTLTSILSFVYEDSCLSHAWELLVNMWSILSRNRQTVVLASVGKIPAGVHAPRGSFHKSFQHPSDAAPESSNEGYEWCVNWLETSRFAWRGCQAWLPSQPPAFRGGQTRSTAGPLSWIRSCLTPQSDHCPREMLTGVPKRTDGRILEVPEQGVWVLLNVLANKCLLCFVESGLRLVFVVTERW